MRQAYASKTIAQWLPTETLIEIIETLPKTDQLTLCRVSELFHDLCLPAINRVVVLRDYAHAKTFLEGILANPSRACAIRSFTVTDRACILRRPQQDWKKTMRSFADLLINLVKLMVPQLEHLSICPDLLATDHGIDLQLYTFPRLLSCHISPHTARDSETQTSTLAADALATFIPAMMAHELGEARLYWGGREDIERTVVALRSMTGPDIPFVSINNGTETHQCTALVEALATHIPNIKTLHMRAATDWGSPDRITIDHLTAYLPHFKGLMYLALEDALSDREVDEESYSVRDKMHTVVVNWAGICPTLEACCLHEFAFKKTVTGTWDFCTRQVFSDLTNALWYFR
ncbi:hypothetical protein DFH08DRAFT_833685 [Mycena albidolilacea]|uniref:F-box domain-containing protein n=1 Tax=Mycena albidolilacea TaxID=1033008 RepID=A0AAD7AQQ9_9AGAR|nr:hypothetical protein DFH08DRAFT_833685 [Mycena albidolilacea]